MNAHRRIAPALLALVTASFGNGALAQRCPPQANVAPGTCVCLPGMQWRSIDATCSVGRCDCAPGTAWNGQACLAVAVPAQPQYAPPQYPQQNPPQQYPPQQYPPQNPPQPYPQPQYPQPPVNAYRWIPSGNGVVPQGAVQGGYDTSGAPLFVCRAPYSGGMHLGKVVGLNCNFGWGGREITIPRYEVLVGPPGRWIPASGGMVPQGAFYGGRDGNGSQLALCRAPYQGGVHPGKVVGQNCNIGYGGAEVTIGSYEVFVP